MLDKEFEDDLFQDVENLVKEYEAAVHNNKNCYFETSSCEQIIDFYENFLKDCPNGYLTRKDFVELFKKLHPIDKNKQKAEKFSEYVFR